MTGIIDWIIDLALAVCFGIKELAVMLISWVPMIELKGAIPIGERMGLGLSTSFWLALMGSSLLCIPLLLILRPLFKWAKKNKTIGSFFERIENIFKEKASNLIKKTESLEGKGEDKGKVALFKALGVFIFVAIPAPMTGVWTGSLVAVLLNLDFFWAVLSIVLGNLVAGLLILLLTALLGVYVDYFLMGLFILVTVLLIIFIYKIFRKKEVEVQNKKTPS